MERLMWVCLGGAAGSGARFLLSGWIAERSGAGFPWGTLCVNLAGCFLLGAILQWASVHGSASPTTLAFLVVGLLGGFTTYSAFNQETLVELQQGAWPIAAANVASTVIGGLAASVLGQVAARALIR